MIYSLKYSPVALETFNEISRQLNSRWGEKYVNKFKERTVSVIESITVSPFMYQAVEFNSSVRKALIHKNCSVFYEIKNTSIEILFFWDNRQEPIL